MFDDEFDPDHEDQHFTNYTIIVQSEMIAEWVEEGCYYDSLKDGSCYHWRAGSDVAYDRT